MKILELENENERESKGDRGGGGEVATEKGGRSRVRTDRRRWWWRGCDRGRTIEIYVKFFEKDYSRTDGYRPSKIARTRPD